MKLNKPMITTLLIVLLGVNLIFFSFINIGKTITKEKFINTIVEKFNFKSFLLDNDNIKNSLDSYKYPKEVFDYIDENNIKILKNNFTTNLLSNNTELISKDNIIYIINNSIYEYENRSYDDVQSYVNNDVLSFSNEFSNILNDDIVNTFQLFQFLSKNIFFYISILISLILISFLIVIEKKNGILLSSIISFVFCSIIYYLDSYFVKNIFIGKNNLKYFSSLDEISMSFEKIYIVCFILSFVLLLVYIVSFIKKTMRDIRISSYEKSWR